ncbi:MAG: hypothetical protein JO235_20345 [Chroococcidiopsidaceae cyanobacterium CP_BM_RX_35]|nr:hypothetical protein [Chroococcidiopsidaceae cyanobacterium CP_BM_RX_35]
MKSSESGHQDDRHSAELYPQAGASTREKVGMWANSNFEDLVQYNDGFRSGLVGTKEQVAERIQQFHAVGVDLILGGFLHYSDDLPAFGHDVIPLVRQLESRRPTKELVEV